MSDAYSALYNNKKEQLSGNKRHAVVNVQNEQEKISSRTSSPQPVAKQQDQEVKINKKFAYIHDIDNIKEELKTFNLKINMLNMSILEYKQSNDTLNEKLSNELNSKISAQNQFMESIKSETLKNILEKNTTQFNENMKTLDEKLSDLKNRIENIENMF